MPRSMADPNYVYTPRSPEERRKLSLAHKARLGIPPDCVRIYGVHVPQEREWPLRQYASYICQKKGLGEAQSFIQEALDTGHARKPSPPKLCRGDRGYIYKPSPQTVNQRIFELSRGTPLSVEGTRVFGIRVPNASAECVMEYAFLAYQRGGLQAARWMICTLWAQGWPTLPTIGQMRATCRAIGSFARSVELRHRKEMLAASVLVARLAKHFEYERRKDEGRAVRIIGRVARYFGRDAERREAQQSRRAYRAIGHFAMSLEKAHLANLRRTFRMCRSIERFAKHFSRRFPVDWSLVEELLSETATKAEVAQLLGVSEDYIKNKLRSRHSEGLSVFGRRVRRHVR